MGIKCFSTPEIFLAGRVSTLRPGDRSYAIILVAILIIIDMYLGEYGCRLRRGRVLPGLGYRLLLLFHVAACSIHSLAYKKTPRYFPWAISPYALQDRLYWLHLHL